MRSANEIKDGAQLLNFYRAMRQLLVSSPEVLADTVLLLHKIVSLSDKVLPMKAYLDVVRDIQRQSARPLCTEDTFMIAAAFLQVEIAKQGAFYYLKGEAPEVKETKKQRKLMDLNDEIVLKDLSSRLARPNEGRGAVEHEQIVSGVNYLGKLVNLYSLMPEVVSQLKSDARKMEVRKQYRLTPTDYDRLMVMARREGKISFLNRKKDPSNSYTLKADHHQRVVEYSQKLGHTPQKALNKILDDFFAMIEKRIPLSEGMN